uniref:Uncharacterized protein n=1 Tax=Arundo donax TaxID=35708 RepID=A0A0A9EPW5_ARUDO
MDPQVVDRRKRPLESGTEGLSKRAKSANDQRTAFIRNQGAKFGAHCDGAREREEPRRLLYPKLGTARGQTLTCSNLALEHFNKSRDQYYCLDRGQPMDSTVFEHTHSRINPGQPMCYCHVNFWARGSRGASGMFFC